MEELSKEEVEEANKRYAEWLGVRPSVRVTAIKPSSVQPGAFVYLFDAQLVQGVHPPLSASFQRRVKAQLRLPDDTTVEDLLSALRAVPSESVDELEITAEGVSENPEASGL